MRCKGSVKTLESAVRDFILDRQIEGCAASTIESYRWQLQPFVDWAMANDETLRAMCGEHLREFLRQRGDAGKPTLYHATVRLKTFFRRCAQYGVCDDLARELRKPRQSRPVITALGVDEQS